MKDITLSVVVPCYNEGENIPLILERFKSVINRDDIEVILVNNGSSDNSENILNEMLPEFSFAKSVKVEVNQGYGFGILEGLKEAKGKYIGWTHADMQTDPYDVLKALEILENSPQDKVFVKGNRKNRPLFDQFFTTGMSFFETILMGAFLWDINAQPNIFHRSLFEDWQNPPFDFALDLFALYSAQKQGYKIKRFDVIFPDRIYGTSHWNTGFRSKIKFIKRTIDFSFKLKRELK